MRSPVDYYVRPMTAADLPAVERLTDAAYVGVDEATRRPGDPAPEHRSPEAARLWITRVGHLLGTDPGGCWVAEDASGVLGVVASLKRELTWVVATFAVRPDLQGRGVGRQLLDAAGAYGAGCLRSMLCASDDPRALRRYRLAGFSLHPMMALQGRVARSELPVVERVREGSAGDHPLLDSVDRQVRGAAHGLDHELLTGLHRLVVVDRPGASGYAYVGARGGAVLLAATNRRTATELLWECLAASSPDVDVSVRHVSAANEWALDVGLACRLALRTEGYLALRGLRPPAPYLPSGQLL